MAFYCICDDMAMGRSVMRKRKELMELQENSKLLRAQLRSKKKSVRTLEHLLRDASKKRGQEPGEPLTSTHTLCAMRHLTTLFFKNLFQPRRRPHSPLPRPSVPQCFVFLCPTLTAFAWNLICGPAHLFTSYSKRYGRRSSPGGIERTAPVVESQLVRCCCSLLYCDEVTFLPFLTLLHCSASFP